jgi:hypothetical protein
MLACTLGVTMSEDPFMYPECEYYGVSLLDSGFLCDPIFELECGECGRQWRVQADTEDFQRL